MTGIGDWVLSYGAAGSYPGASLRFGSVASGLMLTAMPVLDAADFTLDDVANPRGDGVRMGMDVKGSRNVTFALSTNYRNETDARAAVEAAGVAWDAEALRFSPNSYATLTAHTGRVAFGRPRKWAPDDTRSFVGRIDVAPEFLTIDDLWYGPTNVESVGLIPPETGGLMSPLTSPLMIAAAAEKASAFTVGGSKGAWPVFRIKGPIVRPVVSVTGVLRFGFNLTLAYDESIVIDTRPIARSIRKGGADIAADASSSRLLASRLPPGTYELVLSGTAPTGLPSATVSWRDAFTHW